MTYAQALEHVETGRAVCLARSADMIRVRFDWTDERTGRPAWSIITCWRNGAGPRRL